MSVSSAVFGLAYQTRLIRPLSSSSDIGLPADVFTGNSYYDVLIPDSSVSSAVFGLDSQPRLVRSFSSSSEIGLPADVFIGNSNYDVLLGDTSLPLVNPDFSSHSASGLDNFPRLKEL